MTILDLAAIYNATGVAAILLLSVLVARKYPSRFFSQWTRAYIGGLALLLIELAATRLGRPAWLVLPEIVVVVTITWFFVRTGFVLRGGTLSARAFWPLLGAALAPGGLALALGAPFQAAFAPYVVVYALAHIWLGLRLVKVNREGAERGAVWLGYPLIASGVWFFTFPVLEKSPLAWFGFMTSGLLNLLVGIGMIIFLVHDTARRIRRRTRNSTR